MARVLRLLFGVLSTVMLTMIAFASDGQACATTAEVPDSAVILKLRSFLSTLSRSDLLAFYERCDFRLTWTKRRELTVQARLLTGIIGAAENYGLNVSDYPLPKVLTPPQEEFDRVRNDVQISAAVLNFVSDLRCGRLSPREAKADIPDTCAGFNVVDFVWRLSQSTNVASDLTSLEPAAPGYLRTKKALERWERLAILPTVPIPRRQKFDLKHDLELRFAVAERLRLEDDLITLSAEQQASDEDLRLALQAFQKRHGITSTGELSSETYQQLFVPIQDRRKQLELTLERWRWVTRCFAVPPVVVNIPEFRLRVYDDNLNVVFSMKVIVGGAYHRQTPVFSNMISSIDFRPFWNVPSSIQKNEIGPAARRDPNYLAEHNYEIIRGSNGSTRIRQRPGERNSLGLIRFSLPNTHNVYLHDTPRHELFEKIRRDFSHGCIRVESPEKLATWLLQANGKWEITDVLDAMHGGRSFSVKLAAPRPILIVYGTGFTAEDGQTYFLPDIYNEDKRLATSLRNISAARRIQAARLIVTPARTQILRDRQFSSLKSIRGSGLSKWKKSSSRGI